MPGLGWSPGPMLCSLAANACPWEGATGRNHTHFFHVLFCQLGLLFLDISILLKLKNPVRGVFLPWKSSLTSLFSKWQHSPSLSWLETCVFQILGFRTDAETETPVLWPPHVKNWLIGKDSDAGRDWGQEEKGTTEDETGAKQKVNQCAYLLHQSEKITNTFLKLCTGRFWKYFYHIGASEQVLLSMEIIQYYFNLWNILLIFFLFLTF